MYTKTKMGKKVIQIKKKEIYQSIPHRILWRFIVNISYGIEMMIKLIKLYNDKVYRILLF